MKDQTEIELPIVNFAENSESTEWQKEEQHTQIKEAITQFLKRGKKIQILPPQPQLTRHLIGGNKWEIYEDYIEGLGRSELMCFQCSQEARTTLELSDLLSRMN